MPRRTRLPRGRTVKGEANRLWMVAYNAAHKDKTRENNKERMRIYHWAMDAMRCALGNKCAICPATKRPHFDHIVPESKEWPIHVLAMNYPVHKKLFWNEVSKGWLLCASCHTKKTWADVRTGHRTPPGRHERRLSIRLPRRSAK